MNTNNPEKTKMRQLPCRFIILLTIFFSMGCTTVSLEQPKEFSKAISFDSETEYGQFAKNWKEKHGDQSGFFPLVKGADALAARLYLADRAEQSIDLQYFLMSDDTAGLVMADALFRAADRGVRVRFLLDDIFTTEPDSMLLFLARHPNIEIRLFNPISRQGIYYLNFIGNFKQANRRMHNKSFTVDNSISIIGGRNIADEYYQLKQGSTFSDFDMVALGPIAQNISTAFDVFWNHTLAIPVEQLSSQVRLSDQAFIDARTAYLAKVNDTYTRIFTQALSSQLLQDLLTGKKNLYSANAHVLMDQPEKLQSPVGIEHVGLKAELKKVLADAKEEVMVLTPYYVPGDKGVEFAQDLVDRGLDVVMLTNSLASTNHVSVHSGYTRYRKEIVEAGVQLYEIRADAGRHLSDGDGPEQLTLHTKLILIDQRYLFVGSLNLDPRSLDVNSEMGVLLDSKELVGKMVSHIKNELPLVSYHVIKNNNGNIEWHGMKEGLSFIETSEPDANAWLRIKALLMKVAPEQTL